MLRRTLSWHLHKLSVLPEHLHAMATFCCVPCLEQAHTVLTLYFSSVAAYIPACLGAGPTVTFATDKTGQKVTELQQPVLKQPPALNELQNFIIRPLSAKIPVIDSFYNGLVAHNDSLKATIEPASLSGADILAALVVSALASEFEGGDEIVIAGNT